MHRFYVPSQNISGSAIIMDDPKQANHLKNVLRLKEKEGVAIFDDKGNEYSAIIKEFSKDKVTFGIKEKHSTPAARIRLTIACAIPKKSKMDEIIDKLTQLGVDRIIPMDTERVVVKLSREKMAARRLRWQKIALEACQQSQRNTIPEIEPVKQIKEVILEAQGYDLKLIPHLCGERKALKGILEKAKPKNIIVLIGPEGDFSEKEADLAIRSGFIPVTLGAQVLRVDTAAIAVASFIRLYEDY